MATPPRRALLYGGLLLHTALSAGSLGVLHGRGPGTGDHAWSPGRHRLDADRRHRDVPAARHRLAPAPGAVHRIAHASRAAWLGVAYLILVTSVVAYLLW